MSLFLGGVTLIFLFTKCFFIEYTVLGYVLTLPFLFVVKAIAEGCATMVFDRGHMNLDFTYIDDIVSGVQVFLRHENFSTPILK
tara:strand:+ start:149 stop:400 length:252 start_codon:yes stop_codon:yes gene_type:complete